METRFQVINDGVMGGRSQSRIEFLGNHRYRFWGDVSLENQGGFASCRTVGPISFPGKGEDLQISVFPDERIYTVNLYPMMGPMAFSWRAPITAANGLWTRLQLREEDFLPTQFGRVLGASQSGIFGLTGAWGIMISDKRSGPFEISFEWIPKSV